MNAYTKLKSLPLTESGIKSVGNVLFFSGSDQTVGLGDIKHHLSKINANKVDWDFGNLVEKMYVANRMVKDPSCPRNLVNRTYKYKYDVIKMLWNDGRIERVYDEGRFLSFDIKTEDGTIRTFHQLKERSSDRFKIDEVREYGGGSPAILFNEKAVKDFQLAAVYYLQMKRESPVSINRTGEDVYTSKLFYHSNPVGDIHNREELDDVLGQIRNLDIYGYMLIYKGYTLKINPDGTLKDCGVEIY